MVLSSAKYRRHDNEASSMQDPFDDVNNRQSPIIISAAARPTLASSGHLDSLVSLEDDSTGSAAASEQQLCMSGMDEGRVRFVESTVRYHVNPPSFWSMRTALEKGLILFSISTLIFAVVLLLMLTSRSVDQSGATSHQIHITSAAHPQICLTPKCVKISANVLSNMDHTADPCDDFYQYSCGGWQKLNPIPDGHSSWGMFEKMWESNQLVIKNALEENVSVPSVAEEKAKQYYASCLDVEGIIENLAGQPLLQLIKKYFDKWPMLEKQSDEELQDLMPNLETFRQKLFVLHHDLQSEGFFAWSVGENDRNSSQHVIQIDQGGLTLPTSDYYIKANFSNVVLALKKGMLKFAKLLLRDMNVKKDADLEADMEKSINSQIDDVISLETHIANLTTPLAKRREDSQLYTNLTLGHLNELADFLNWTEYFQNAFSRVGKNMSDSVEIVLYASRYTANISDLIKEHMTTPRGRRTLYNYMIWHAVKSLRLALSKDYREASKDLEKAMLGKNGHTDRWRVCVTDTDSVFGFAVGAMFVRKAFDGESKPSAQGMINSIKEAFEKRLLDLGWMDSETQEAAISKARAITDMIGFPEYILDNKQLDDKYNSLNVSSVDYFGNNLRAKEYTFFENMNKLHAPVNRTRWSMSPATVNAYYTPTKNQIVFPAGILQSPFFNLDYPRSLNYGAMGVVMGHELSHAFDDQGREYDEHGNMRQWWNNETLIKFKNRTSCMETQYSSYKFQAQNISGEQTLGENIADNGGLKTSYYAYQGWLRSNRIASEPLLPGLNLTHNQLFFLSFAQVWCSTLTPQANELQILEDSHSPSRFRVIGVLSNSKEFSEVFGCKLGSKMNPSHKCEVW